MSKVVLVTGATGNLGREVCKILSEKGFIVYGTKLPGSQENSDFATIIEADLTKSSATVALIEEIQQYQQNLYAVVCLAGGFEMSNIESTTSDDIAASYKLNFDTAFNITSGVWSWLKNSGEGRVVFIGAKPAVEGGAFEMLPYALSKRSVIHLAEILNESSNDSGITASVIVPSIIDTPANRAAMPDAIFSNWVTPKEIATQIAHLLSDDSSAIRNPILRLYGKS
jgi:NAD(P)-dependent dehydrogenase (short-subunit alcohol dehydrogenase family)